MAEIEIAYHLLYFQFDVRGMLTIRTANLLCKA